MSLGRAVVGGERQICVTIIIILLTRYGTPRGHRETRRLMPPRSPCRVRHDRRPVSWAIGLCGRSLPRSDRVGVHVFTAAVQNITYNPCDVQITGTHYNVKCSHHQSLAGSKWQPSTGIRVPSVDRCERARCTTVLAAAFCACPVTSDNGAPLITNVNHNNNNNNYNINIIEVIRILLL